MADIVFRDVGTKELEENMQSLVQQFCRNLQQLWQEMGFGKTVQQRRGQMVNRHLRMLMQDLLVEEKKFLNRMIESINKSNDKIGQLCHELAIRPLHMDDDLPLVEMEKKLRTKVDQLQKEKQFQIEKLRKLQNVEQQLCAELSLQPYRSSGTQTIGQQMASLQEHIGALQKEKENRMARINLLRKDVADLMTATEYSPSTPFGRNVFVIPENNLLPTNDTIDRINRLKQQLEIRQQETKRHGNALRERLVHLWEILNIEQTQRIVFLQRYPDDKPSTIRAIRREMQKCEALVNENRIHLIENLREELQGLWDKCYAPQELRDQFHAFKNENLDEEQFELHRKEVQKWRTHYQKWIKLFEGIENLKIQWQRATNFEKQSNDPKRFANRRGFLLQEERTRKRLNKGIQEAEDVVQALASNYSQQEEWPVKVGGSDLANLVANYRQEYAREKPRVRKQLSVR